MADLKELSKRLEELEAGEAAHRQEVEALRKELQKYHDLLNESSDPIFSFFPDGRYRHVNKAFADGVGRKQEEIIGKKIWDIFPQDEADKRFAVVKWVFENAQTRVIEVRVPRPDGDRYYITTVKPSLDEQGRVVTALCISKEITDRKKAEDQLRISEERYRTILENIEDGYYEVDLAGTFLFVNDSFLKITGYSAEELIGKKYKVFSNPSDIQNAFEAYHQVFLTGNPIERFEWQFPRKTGEKRLFEISISLMKDPSGSPLGFQGIVRDVTDRKEAEESLKESEERYRTAIEHSNDGFALIKDGIHLYVNQKICRIFDYDRPEEIIGKPIGLLTHPDDYERVIDIHKRRDRGEAAPSSYEFKGRKKDGEPVFVEISVSQTIYKGESVILAYLRDITGRKKADEERQSLETQMQEVQKLESLGVLAGGIAHDFNNLLMAILGNADLALFSLTSASPARHNIEEILRASQRAADLCRQMLAYSGKGRFLVGRHNLGEIIQEMTQMLEVSISKKAVLHYAFAEALPAVEADATQMRQVIMNLITNASEALEEKSGIISLSCGVRYCDRSDLADSYMDDKLPEGNYVFLEVSDTGKGMDAETKRRLFEPFYSTKFTGRGLGLAAVLGIVRGHKGAIKVQSEPDKGTTFRIMLPALAQVVPNEIDEQKESGPIKEGAVILMVDDDYHVRKVGTEMLTRLGFKVLIAEDGRKGLKTFRDHKEEIDCVILDLSMPEMGGEEAFHQFLLLKPDLPVILSSGYNEQDVAQRFNIRGVAGFIQKPYTVFTMREILKKVLGEEKRLKVKG